MGTVEKTARTKRRKTQVQRIILGTIATAGLIGLMAVAPNALQVLAMFDGGRCRKKRAKYVVETAFLRLLDKGHVCIKNTPKGKFVRLTEDGKLVLARMVASSPDSRPHKRWDKRWRMVTYDISEKRKVARDRLLHILRSFGFYKLQNSVWIYPYDTEELVTLLKADFKIGKEVLYVVVERIENDAVLKAHFKLA